MPFFQATSTKVPLAQEVTGAYPSAEPYRSIPALALK
jgi:hypothetical protein